MCVHECVWESTFFQSFGFDSATLGPVCCLLGNNGCTILNKYVLKDVGRVRERERKRALKHEINILLGRGVYPHHCL